MVSKRVATVPSFSPTLRIPLTTLDRIGTVRPRSAAYIVAVPQAALFAVALIASSCPAVVEAALPDISSMNTATQPPSLNSAAKFFQENRLLAKAPHQEFPLFASVAGNATSKSGGGAEAELRL